MRFTVEALRQYQPLPLVVERVFVVNGNREYGPNDSAIRAFAAGSKHERMKVTIWTSKLQNSITN